MLSIVSGIFDIYKVSVSVITYRREKDPTCMSPLERASFDLWSIDQD
jgi:hypothetical protein